MRPRTPHASLFATQNRQEILYFGFQAAHAGIYASHAPAIAHAAQAMKFGRMHRMQLRLPLAGVAAFLRDDSGYLFV
jgi:hypothetical protein